MEKKESREERQAREVLQNPVFRKSVATVSDYYFQQWVASTEVAQREEIYARMSVLKDVVSELEAQLNIYTGDGE